MERNAEHIYLDHASTTPLDSRVKKAMDPFFSESFGNTMTLYELGRQAREAVEAARGTLSRMIGARSSEIIFTSSATESNNHAIKGAALANEEKGAHVVISSVEHESVRGPAEWLARFGFEVTKVGTDKEGFVHPSDVEKALRKDTVLVSVMHASNEMGTIQPVKKIGALCKKKGILFHVDAVQSFGKIPVNVREMEASFLSASSHKLYGPKGAALLYIKEGVSIPPLLHGGEHEEGRRASTLNVPSLVGFAEAARLCQKDMEKESERESALRDLLIDSVLSGIDRSGLIGPRKERLCNHASFWIEGARGEDLVLALDEKGISAGTGAACATVKMEPSKALLAAGISPQRAQSSLRLTLGRSTRKKDIVRAAGSLKEIVGELRRY